MGLFTRFTGGVAKAFGAARTNPMQTEKAVDNLASNLYRLGALRTTANLSAIAILSTEANPDSMAKTELLSQCKDLLGMFGNMAALHTSHGITSDVRKVFDSAFGRTQGEAYTERFMKFAEGNKSPVSNDTIAQAIAGGASPNEAEMKVAAQLNAPSSTYRLHSIAYAVGEAVRSVGSTEGFLADHKPAITGVIDRLSEPDTRGGAGMTMGQAVGIMRAGPGMARA